ncbi:hypothetical protein CEXT_253221 [Caerostris extrusa]|uniref:Uncharacterized protein n=1 Tax=Caerostris extrusa TaxID=172846 RepID=A0AAV4TE13_CAEEX|nr:hypothetical protein CEXT_253221 [Caerostris extrusa]
MADEEPKDSSTEEGEFPRKHRVARNEACPSGPVESRLADLHLTSVFLSSSFLKPKPFIAKDIHSSPSTSVLRNAIKLFKRSLASVVHQRHCFYSRL